MSDCPPLFRFRDAYLAMASFYRPQAPGDGMGTVLLTPAQCRDRQRLEQEALAYAAHFIKEEDDGRFCIGCSDYETNRAFMWVIEAARQLAGGIDGRATAVKLLRMAIKDIEVVKAS